MAWTREQVIAVWCKGRIVPPNDAAVWRQDVCTAWIRFDDYGDRNSPYGWEIDHIDPRGGDHISNLQPLQWENNAAKSDGRLVCVVRSQGAQNVRVGQVPKR